MDLSALRRLLGRSVPQGGMHIDDGTNFQRLPDGRALVNGVVYPAGTQEDDPSLPDMMPRALPSVRNSAQPGRLTPGNYYGRSQGGGDFAVNPHGLSLNGEAPRFENNAIAPLANNVIQQPQGYQPFANMYNVRRLQSNFYDPYATLGF